MLLDMWKIKINFSYNVTQKHELNVHGQLVRYKQKAHKMIHIY